jgi:hypothetical protein
VLKFPSNKSKTKRIKNEDNLEFGASIMKKFEDNFMLMKLLYENVNEGHDVEWISWEEDNVEDVDGDNVEGVEEYCNTKATWIEEIHEGNYQGMSRFQSSNNMSEIIDEDVEGKQFSRIAGSR